jgi:hypothetical protein
LETVDCSMQLVESSWFLLLADIWSRHLDFSKHSRFLTLEMLIRS